jgi:asparagine synthase (glutamine-hydrolysing)
MHTYLVKIDLQNSGENLSDQHRKLQSITNNFLISYSHKYKEFDLISFDDHIIFSHSRFENSSHLIQKYNLNSGATHGSVIYDSLIKKKFDLTEIEGPFSFLIFDRKNKTVKAFSDHLNMYPIYYHFDGKSIIFSNSIKTLLNFNNRLNHICKETILDYLISGMPTNGNTIYEKIKIIKANHFIYAEKDFIKEQRYSYFSQNINKEKDENFYKNSVLDRFESVLKNQLNISSSNIGITLSGGIDSSSILSLISTINNRDSLKKKINCYSAVFPNLEGESLKRAYESNYVQDLKEFHNFEHQNILFSKDGSIKISNEIAQIDEPFVAPNFYLYKEFYKACKDDGVKNLFEGIGGDSTISHGLAKFIKLSQSFKFKSLFNEYDRYNKIRGRDYSLYDFFKRYIVMYNLPYSAQKFYYGYIRNHQDYFNANSYLRKEFQVDTGNRFEQMHGYHPYAISKKNNPEENTANDISTPYSNRISYYFSSKNNIRSHYPFYNRNLIQLCLNVPIEIKLKDGISRHYFKEAIKDYVPKSIYSRNSKADISGLFLNELLSVDKKELLDNIFCSDTHLVDILDRNKFNNQLEILHKTRNQVLGASVYKIFILNKWLEKNS